MALAKCRVEHLSPTILSTFETAQKISKCISQRSVIIRMQVTVQPSWRVTLLAWVIQRSSLAANLISTHSILFQMRRNFNHVGEPCPLLGLWPFDLQVLMIQRETLSIDLHKINRLASNAAAGLEIRTISLSTVTFLCLANYTSEKRPVAHQLN